MERILFSLFSIVMHILLISFICLLYYQAFTGQKLKEETWSWILLF